MIERFLARTCCVLLAAAAFAQDPQTRSAEIADLALLNAKAWTGEKAGPWAEAIAIRGNRILRVGSNAEIRTLIRHGSTHVLDLKRALVLPGFIDNHVHLAWAGRLLLGLNLLDVNDASKLRQRVAEAAKRLPPGAWLVGGDWGAYAQWKLGSSGKPSPSTQVSSPVEFLPTKELIDAVTGDHPTLISRFDQKLFLANTLALKAAGIISTTPNPEGGEILKDARGQPNGLLRGTAVQLVRKVIPPPSYAQRRAEALRALAEARQWGVTSMHDNVVNSEQLELLRDLQRSGELTSRIWARMWLSDWKRVVEYVRSQGLKALPGGWGDDMIRLGGLKAWVDGIMGNSTALFFEPYNHDPGNRGRLRDVMFPEDNLYRLTKDADAAGLTVTVHAIGDAANRILLDTYERVFAENPSRDRRFRVVHAQVVHPADLPRFGKLKLVAEVQPYHAIDDMRWMEERIGQRARWAYPFRSLAEAGAVLSCGSDWPGTNASYYPVNPLLGIYAAVTRQTLEGQPPQGWFPEQRLTIEEAVHCFTVNNAYATFEEDSKGSLREGKLADLVVLDRDIFARPPRELLEAKVLYTIVGGRVVLKPADN